MSTNTRNRQHSRRKAAAALAAFTKAQAEQQGGPLDPCTDPSALAVAALVALTAHSEELQSADLIADLFHYGAAKSVRTGGNGFHLVLGAIALYEGDGSTISDFDPTQNAATATIVRLIAAVMHLEEIEYGTGLKTLTNGLSHYADEIATTPAVEIVNARYPDGPNEPHVFLYGQPVASMRDAGVDWHDIDPGAVFPAELREWRDSHREMSDAFSPKARRLIRTIVKEYTKNA